MTVSLDQLKSYGRFALELNAVMPSVITDAATTELRLVNEAGRYFTDMWPWSWTEQYAELDFDVFAFTGGSWTASSLTLSVTAGNWTKGSEPLELFAFSDLFGYYRHEPGYGQNVTITGGTGVTTGDYRIASKTSATAVVLETKIKTTNASDVAGTLALTSVRLPSNFREPIRLEGGRGTTYRVELMGWGDFLLSRQHDVASPNVFRAAFTTPTQGAVSENTGNPRMEIDPDPPANEPDALQLVYRRTWTELASGSDIANVPMHMEAALRQYVEQAYLGFIEGDVAAQFARFAALDQSHYMAELKSRDGRSQGTRGPVSGSYLDRRTMRGIPHQYRGITPAPA